MIGRAIMMCIGRLSYRKLLGALFLLGSICLFHSGAASALDSRTSINQYGVSVWTTENGLPQNTIRDIIQTHDGYIWLATNGGLVRFDGIDFTVFDTHSTPQIKSNEIRSLMEDRQGALWICTSQGLTRFANQGFSSYATADGLSSDNVLSAFEDREGTVWVTTTGGLCSSEGAKGFRSRTSAEGLPGNAIETLIEDQRGSLWVGTDSGLARFGSGVFTPFVENGFGRQSVKALREDHQGRLWIGTQSGLFCLDGGKLTSYTIGEGLSNNSVRSILEDKSGSLWVGTLDGLNQLKDGKIKVFTAKDGLPGNRIESIYQDRDGSIWVITTDGLARFTDGGFAPLTTREGLSSDRVLSIFEDREGDMWLGTESGGLNLLRDKRITTYTTGEGLSDNLVTSIYQDAKSNIWIGTKGGGLNLLRDGQVTQYTTKDGLCSNVVLGLCGDRKGALWIGTPDGLSRFKDGRFTSYTSADGLADDFVRSVYQDREGRLWIGTRRGLTRFENGRFTVLTTLDGLPNDFIGAILEDHTGSLWISTLGGLSRYRDGAFQNFTTHDGLSSDVTTSLFEDSEGALWIGTQSSGLNRFSNGKFNAYLAKDGLFDEVIYQILEDGRDNLWLGCSKGIFRVSKRELADFAAGRLSSITSISYGTADGMRIRECSSGGHPAECRTNDGRLWFSTLKGVAVIDPDHLKVNELAPPVVIDRVEVDGQTLDPSRKADLSPGRTSFAFYYAGLSFLAPDKVRFRYKLEGFDKDWVDPATRRVAYYTNIPPGSYTFRVIACNNDGIWNEAGASFPFYLAPRFYQTFWFYSLCVAGLALGGWWLYLRRMKHVESEFAAVLGERNRLAREIHDTLAQGLAGISIQLELVAKALSVSTDMAATYLSEARLQVRNSLADARRSVWDLRSESLEKNDLPTAISNSAKQITANSPVKVQLQVSGAFRELDPLVERNLLRIGEEAVTNAVKHAQARQIDIGLQFADDLVRLTVRDDGVGFEGGQPAPSANGHFGLLGMRERADQIRSKLSISSSPGNGTRISVEVPIRSSTGGVRHP
jgi:ligand-binding sensor domain-containing protein/two-component sensor histidine kinase